MDSSRNQPQLSRGGIWNGLREMTPIAAFVVPFGVAFGVAGTEAGMTAGDAIVMSAAVFAAACQFAVLEIWGEAVPLVPLVLIVLAINARHILTSAALAPWLSGLPWPKRLASLSVLSDANFAAGMAAYGKGERDIGVVVGGGIVLWVGWVAGTIAGAMFGDWIGNPNVLALDVVMIAFFAALLTGSWRGKASVKPWAAAAAVSLAAYWWAPPNWHVIAGALAGGLVGALQNGD